MPIHALTRLARPLAVAAATAVLVPLALVASPTSPPATAAPAAGAAGLVPVDPVRDVDTRIGLGGAGLSTGETRFVALGPVPDDATAVMLNVTAVAASAAGHLAVTDCRPGSSTSAVNFVVGRAVPNQVVVGLADRSAGEPAGVCVTASAPTELIIDRFGHVAPDGAAFAPAPARSWDTRSAGGIGADGVLVVDLADAVPGGGRVVAWSGTVTATAVRVPGYVTVWPCAIARPVVSNLNLAVGVTVANQVTVALPADDPRLCLDRVGDAELVVDTTGFWHPGGTTTMTPLSPPGRAVDSRLGERLLRDEVRRLHGPADAELFVNLTATRANGAGWAALFPCGSDHPGTSTLNVVAGADVSAAATVSARDGGVCVTTSVSTDVVLDVFAVQHASDRSPPSEPGVPPSGVTVSPGIPDDPSVAVVSGCTVGPLDQLNAARAASGLLPLVRDQRTDSFACEWATAMATAGRMSHSTATQRSVVDACGITGENVAAGGASWTWMIDAWLESPAHREVALHTAFTRASVAYVSRDQHDLRRWYGVTVFGGSC